MAVLVAVIFVTYLIFLVTAFLGNKTVLNNI